ncbi:MAG: UPF0182 family protein [Gemmatimonadota bacterium]|jgi:uncharacterized membrane protein (UPF0182 family)
MTSKPSFRPGGRGRLFLVAVVALGALLILGRLLVELYIEVLWHGEVGYLGVFWTRTLWSAGTRFLAGLIVGLAIFLNLRLVARTLSGIQIKRRFGNLEISEQLPKSYVLWGMLALSALLGLWFGGSVHPDTGIQLLLALRGGEWGIVDPILGRDASFYMFVLPLLRAAVTFALITAFLVFTVCAGGYAATGSLRWGEKGVVMGEQPRIHLGSVVAAFILLLAVQFLLGRYVLLQDGSSSVQGIFGYADAHARLPGLTVMAGLAVLGGALVFWGALKNRLVPALTGVGVVLVGGLLVGQLWPALVQRFQVEPNELERETPYILHNIAFTRTGFGLSDLERERFDYAPPEEGIDWMQARRQFEGLPVWTAATLLTTFRELEARYAYYDFNHVAIDRYRTGADDADSPREPVALSVREVDPAAVEDPNWQNRHIRERYLAGMGAVAAAAAERTEEGRPPMYLSAIPPEFARGAPPALDLTRPNVYVTATPQRYAIVNPSDTAFVDSLGARGEAGEDFPEGIVLSSLGRTFAFAWRFRDPNLFFAREVTDSSRFVFRRQVLERVRSVAPFFDYPEAPYPVVEDGRIVWILEGFTAARAFPLSSPYALPWRAPASWVRNSLKVTVDGVTGEVRFYALPGEDPLLEAYARAFPGLVRPLEEMPPELREHLRYARGLLALQSEVLLQYHQNTAPQFHGQQDVWAHPRELFQSTNPVSYEAEYGIYRLPGDDEDGFHLTTVFVPVGRQNLTAITAGRLLPDGTRRLVLFDVPVEDQVPGPRQVEALVEQDPEISQQFSLWRTGGSQVWTGHLHLVPVGSNILYMEPVFLAAEADAIPQLRGFVVSDGNRVSMEPTLEGAVAALAGRLPSDFAGDEGTVAGTEGLPGAGAASSVPSAERWPAEALEVLDRAESRLREGDYQGFGEALAELRSLLEELGGGGDGGGAVAADSTGGGGR